MNISRRKKIGGGWECDKIGGNVSPRIFFPRGMFTFVCTHHVHAPRETEALSPPRPPQFSGWTDCELVLDHRTVRLMAAAFLPQFGCFARSQINALDRHGRSCWRSASRVLPFTGSSILPFDFENWENTVSCTVEQGWSIEWTRWRGREKKKRKIREWYGMGLRDNVLREMMKIKRREWDIVEIED